MKDKPKAYLQYITSINAIQEPAVAYKTKVKTDVISMINTSREGLTMKEVVDLSALMSIDLSELSQVLHLSLRTLQRYSMSKRLDSDSSSKAIQLKILYNHGLDVFGDNLAFGLWLHSVLPALGGQRPLDYLDTPFGFQLIDQMLGRIEHGIFA